MFEENRRTEKEKKFSADETRHANPRDTLYVLSHISPHVISRGIDLCEIAPSREKRALRVRRCKSLRNETSRKRHGIAARTIGEKKKKSSPSSPLGNTSARSVPRFRPGKNSQSVGRFSSKTQIVLSSDRSYVRNLNACTRALHPRGGSSGVCAGSNDYSLTREVQGSSLAGPRVSYSAP